MSLRLPPNRIGASVRTLTRAILWASLVPLLASCTIPREITRTARSAIEQLLLAEALNRSLLDVALPLSIDEPLYMEVSGLQLGYMTPLVPLPSVSSSGEASTTTSSTSGYFRRPVISPSSKMRSPLIWACWATALPSVKRTPPISCVWSCNRSAPANRSRSSACRRFKACSFHFRCRN